MRRISAFLLMLVSLVALGCGGERDKAKNKDRERPEPPKKEAADKK